MLSLEVLDRLNNVAIGSIYIVDEYSSISEDIISRSIKGDVFFTYDFRLKKYLDDRGIIVFFLDHILDKNYLNKNNFVFYKFFENWFKDDTSKDIFIHRDIPFGFSFRLDVWNDMLLYVKKYLCLQAISELHFDKMFVMSSDKVISDILTKFNISHSYRSISTDGMPFYFPITKWLSERLAPTGFRKFLYKSRSCINNFFSLLFCIFDRYFSKADKIDVFLQEYHPTKKILNSLRADPKIRLHLVNFSKASSFLEKLRERVLPIKPSVVSDTYLDEIIINFKDKRIARLILDNGHDISENIYEIIESCVKNSLTEKLNVLDSCISYVEQYEFKLLILISNIGLTTTLFDCVCKTKGITSYLIINGLFGPDYLDESKFANYINSYSESIKSNYFNAADNVYVLGDPRMDCYDKVDLNFSVDRVSPKIVIGASGYNNLDLNSYVAVEFDFLYDILTSIENHIALYGNCDVCIKVRPNGYLQQYKSFVSFYFPKLIIEFQDVKPMHEVLNEADLYISIYSQTLFEASCLGVPVIYYKKDTEVLTEPFDGNSELVTVTSIDGLNSTLKAYRNGDGIFDSFLKREVMEKYIGPLDGNNTKRNINFIYDILESVEA